MSALIGALRVSLSAETAQFEAGMKRAQRTATQTRSSFQKAFGGLGGVVKAGLAGVVSGLSIGLFIQGAKNALEYAGSLGEVSQQLGVTTKDLQVFRYAAGQVGVSQEQLETGLSKLTITLGKVAAGAKAPAAALKAIGVSAEQLKGKDTGEAFRIVADGLQKVGDRSQRAAVEVALFGKSGAMLDNLLAGGSVKINELSAAAERLGIVLSDEQIQSADDTADKLSALQTVLSAQIAGVVADNADSILGFADSISKLVSVLSGAIGYLRAFQGALNALAAKRIELSPFSSKEEKGNARAALFRARLQEQIGLGTIKPGAIAGAGKPKVSGSSISPFLAGGSGGGRHKADDSERKRQQALREAYQFDQDLLRAQRDVVSAQQQLATDYSERAALSIQMLNLDQQGFEREMQYALASGELNKTQADQLKAEFAKKDALERQAVLAEEERQRYEDYNHLDQVDFDLQRDILESQEQIADTAKEQRDIRLRLLDLDYRAEKARLDAVIADEQASYAAKEEARRRLQGLNKTYGNDRQGVLRDTAGPFERAQLQFGDLSEEMENLKVNGIMGAADALTALTGGFNDFKDAAISAIKQVIAEFIRLQLLKAAFSLFGGGTGGVGGAGLSLGSSMPGAMSFGGGFGLTGMASGGSGVFGGISGIDRNVLSLNGLPIAKVSKGERFSVSNENGPRSGGGGVSITQHFSGPISRETMMQVGAKTRAAVAQANRKGAA